MDKKDYLNDIAINIVDKLVEKGIIKDCIGTEDLTEFETQDIIVDILNGYIGGINE